jgi:hypothetical protein
MPDLNEMSRIWKELSEEQKRNPSDTTLVNFMFNDNVSVTRKNGIWIAEVTETHKGTGSTPREALKQLKRKIDNVK